MGAQADRIRGDIEKHIPSAIPLYDGATEVCKRVSESYLAGKKIVVTWITDNVPEPYKTVLEKVIHVVPEIFVCFSAISGIMTFPALCYLAYHSFTPLGNLVEKIASGECLWKDFVDSGGQWLHKCEELVRERITPALFVAFSIHAAVSLVKGLFAVNSASLLYSICVAGPVALIAFKSMLPPTNAESM